MTADLLLTAFLAVLAGALLFIAGVWTGMPLARSDDVAAPPAPARPRQFRPPSQLHVIERPRND
jgi:hypothetical protein